MLRCSMENTTHTEFLSPVNGSFPADELVAVGAGVLHALVHALHVHLQLVVQRESFAAHAARVRLQTLSWVLSEMRTFHCYSSKKFNFFAIFPKIRTGNPCGCY
jgi:hypothetical protein